MFPSSDKADDLHPILIGLQKRAESEDDPAEQDGIKAIEGMLAKRLARNLISTWPGLFRLYQHPDGSWEVDFEEPLEQRRRRLEEGLTPEDSEVILCLEALEYIWGSIIIDSPKGIPVKSDIPFPGLSKNGFGSNILEIHQAAVGLFEQTIMAAIVTDTSLSNRDFYIGSLPKRPYCTDLLGRRLRIMGAEKAAQYAMGEKKVNRPAQPLIS